MMRNPSNERCPMDAKHCERGCVDRCLRSVPQLQRRKYIYGRGWPTMVTLDGMRELNKDKPHIRLRYGVVMDPVPSLSVQFMSGAETGVYKTARELQPIVERRLRAHRLLA
jgi:hypothetical protein